MLDNENRNCNCNCNCGSMMNNNSNMMVENNDYPNTMTAPAGFGMNSNNCNCCCEKAIAPRIPMYSYEFTNIGKEETCPEREATREEMIQEIRCLSFAIVELAEYLDTHNDDEKEDYISTGCGCLRRCSFTWYVCGKFVAGDFFKAGCK